MPVHATAMPHHVPKGVPRGANLEQLCVEKEPKHLPLLSPPCKAAAEPDLAPALVQR